MDFLAKYHSVSKRKPILSKVLQNRPLTSMVQLHWTTVSNAFLIFVKYNFVKYKYSLLVSRLYNISGQFLPVYLSCVQPRKRPVSRWVIPATAVNQVVSIRFVFIVV